ncbi:MAG: phytanoyl-CoA dioxygenase family protein [Deltaproteobacteria bacterium]|nr:phytanoyl-CoA dioxygenase family protein [Deltaproteobacteria bacterium]
MKKHELNGGFDWQDRTGPFRLLSEDQAAQYNRDGFVVLEDVFDDETIDALLTELDPLEELGAELLRKHFDGKAFIARADEITFTVHVVTRSPLANAFTHSKFFLDVTHDLLGPDVRLYWDQLVYKKPGNPEVFPWHQDNGYTFIEPQQYLTCWVAMSDADEENGCPWVIPGAHREGTYAHHMTDLGWECTTEEPKQRVAAPVRKGGVVVFSSLTPHLTGPNQTAHMRKTYIVQFAPDGASGVTVQNGKRSEAPCRAPDRQYPILVDGKPVPPPGVSD